MAGRQPPHKRISANSIPL